MKKKDYFLLKITMILILGIDENITNCHSSTLLLNIHG